MLAQLATYIILSIQQYHASKTFKFINASPMQEHAFVLKGVKSLKALPYNIFDKYYMFVNH